MRKYANAAGTDDDEPRSRLRVTPDARQRGTDRAADTAPHLHGVSTRDLRWRFAASLLDDGVPPDVVCALGGWDRLDRLDPLLDDRTAKPSSQPSTGRAGGRRQAVTATRQWNAVAGAAAAATAKRWLHQSGRPDRDSRLRIRLAGRADWRRTDTARDDDSAEAAVEQQIDAHIESASTPLDVGEVRVVDDSVGSVALVALVREDAVSGVVGVGTGEGLTDAERAVLSALGVQIGHAQSPPNANDSCMPTQ